MLATLSGGASLSFKVVTSPGAAPRWNGAVVDSRHRRTRDSFTRIGPGKSLDVHLDLAQELTFTTAGRYVIEVLYESSYHDDVEGAWRGRLRTSVSVDLMP
jgi:hypothetical protein